MKYTLPLLFSGIFILQADTDLVSAETPIVPVTHSTVEKKCSRPAVVTFQNQPGTGRMSAITFKSQDYCRAELENFDFDAHFSIVSATVYFTGANFKGVEKGIITSNKLKPIESLKARCIPGSIVVFDDVKVKGPDDMLRTIPGVTYMLY